MNNDGFEADLFSHSSPQKQAKNRTTQFQSMKRGSIFSMHNRHIPQMQKQRNDAEDDNGSRGTCSRVLRRFVSLMLSHLGTLFIVVLYVLMGGFLFEYLEQGNEISSCETKESKYISKRNAAVDLLYNIAQGTNATLAKSAILSEVEKFSKDLFALSFDPALNCSSLSVEGGDTVSWNLVNAAYFCVTIVTTIGYGHISPGTQWGQIVCMIYSILGIPLMLLFLTKIGEPTAVLFRSFYLNIFCCKCFVKNKHLRKVEQEQKEKDADKHTSWETVEEGDGVSKPPPKVHVIDDDEDEDEDDENEVVNIPITVTLILLIMYILIGAAVFKIWEKEWSLVEGTYFSFITLTTIGFGDYVPGRDGPFDDPAVITELLVGCVYCLFGLAMLSMCISLIQDEIAAKFHWVGLKLGLIKPRTDDDDDDDDDDEDDSSSDDDDDDEEEEKRKRKEREGDERAGSDSGSGDPGSVSSKAASSVARSKSSGRRVLVDSFDNSEA